jgi:tripartite-type tricarboxylate transporter receptor subunit TctC
MAHAQSWPSKPVRIIVPAPAGSSLDLVARFLGDRLKDTWQQPIVIDNKPGAGGTIGAELAAKAPPDGHTLLMGFPGPTAFAPYLYRKLGYDPITDLRPVVLTSTQPNVLAVGNTVPAKNVKELVVWLRNNNGKANYASIGPGSSSHLSMELFKARAHFEANHIPYNGSPPAGVSLANGDTQLLFAVASGIAPHVASGKVRLLAVTSAERFAPLKELPTLAESGLPLFEAVAWNGLFVASATSPDVIKKVNQDVNAALGRTEIKARLFAAGMAPGGGSVTDFEQLVRKESRAWGAVITRINVKLD